MTETVLPPGWEMVPLGEMVDEGPSNGYSGKTGAAGSPTLKLSATTQRRMLLNETTTKRLADTLPADSKYWLRPGDLLVQRANTLRYLGAAAIYDGPEDTYVYPDLMMRLRVRDDATRRYLWRFLNSPACQEYFRAKATGSAGNMPKINGKTVRATPVPLPPPEQRTDIVARIESLQARSHRAKEALDAIPPLLERFRQSVLAAAFRGDLTADWRRKNPDVEPASVLLERTEAPSPPRRYKSRSKALELGDYALAVGNPGAAGIESWSWVELGRVGRLESGHTPSRRHPEYWDGEIPWVSIPDARDNHGRVIQSTRCCVTQAGLDNSASRLLPEGSVFLCRTAASIGYTLILGRPMATSQDLVAWVCTPALLPKFLMWLFVAEKQAILRFAKGSAHKTVYFPEILSFHVCLPPLAEQQQIVDEIETRVASAERIAAVAGAAQDTVPRLDESILASAFRGEL